MLRVISLNLNGIRSAATKGVFDWLQQQQADVVCLQELKAQHADLTEQMQAPAAQPDGPAFHSAFHPAQKKGYSGVGLYARQQPTAISEGIGVDEFDAEGRFLRADFAAADGDAGLSVISLYLPSGSASEDRQASKFRFLDVFMPRMQALMDEHRQTGREFIVCGDWNIAHKEVDLKNWKSNQKNSGFLPEERAWLTTLFDQVGWVDVFRKVEPHATDTGYTWWSNRGQAWANNVGWRIDYQIATPGIAARAQAASIYKAQRFSDHAPLIIDYGRA